jgi:hypothetical protein
MCHCLHKFNNTFIYQLTFFFSMDSSPISMAHDFMHCTFHSMANNFVHTFNCSVHVYTRSLPENNLFWPQNIFSRMSVCHQMKILVRLFSASEGKWVFFYLLIDLSEIESPLSQCQKMCSLTTFLDCRCNIRAVWPDSDVPGDCSDVTLQAAPADSYLPKEAGCSRHWWSTCCQLVVYFFRQSISFLKQGTLWTAN